MFRLYAASSGVVASEIAAATVGASFAPDIVTVTVIVSDKVPEPSSLTVIVYCSVTESPESKAVVSESELSNVYVHAPVAELIAKEPYVPDVELVLYDNTSPVSGSVPETVPVAVVLEASSVTEPV